MEERNTLSRSSTLRNHAATLQSLIKMSLTLFSLLCIKHKTLTGKPLQFCKDLEEDTFGHLLSYAISLLAHVERGDDCWAVTLYSTAFSPLAFWSPSSWGRKKAPVSVARLGHCAHFWTPGRKPLLLQRKQLPHHLRPPPSVNWNESSASSQSLPSWQAD